ncbi:MAG: hypothetical protein OCD01_01025 [Fibrobacterales bacterium]
MKKPVTVRCPSCDAETVEDFEYCTSWNDLGLSSLSSTDRATEYAKLQVYNDSLALVCTGCQKVNVGELPVRTPSTGMGKSVFAFPKQKRSVVSMNNHQPDHISEPVLSQGGMAQPVSHSFGEPMYKSEGMERSVVTERVEKVTQTVSQKPLGNPTQDQSNDYVNSVRIVDDVPDKHLSAITISMIIILIFFAVVGCAFGAYHFMKHFGSL